VTKAAAKTGEGPTVTVAIEQYFPENQRLIEDPLAFSILPFGMRSFVWLMQLAATRNWMVRAVEKSAPGIWGGLMCRKRYIDEKLIEVVDQVNAVVNLGAGFDTRVYRLPALAKTSVWEVDQPGNIKLKQVRLQKLFGKIPAHVKLVPIDFDHDELIAALTLHGYSIDEPTFFICEAVTQYLTEIGIKTTFDFLAKSKRGSRLVFTYVRKDFLDGRVRYGQENLYRQYVVKNNIWLFGIDPQEMTNFLEPYGWRVVEHLSYEELAEKYVKPSGRELSSTLIEQIVYAEKI
jgi:methyltransferase (TIGR00027 family)